MINLETLGHHIPEQSTFTRPPSERWQPELCGDIDIRIDEQGQWIHEGVVIRRATLVRLLASVLVREDGEYWLKTPVEKMRIQVADAPFLVTELNTGESADAAEPMQATTSVGESLSLSSPWDLAPDPAGEMRPWIRVTETLGARLSRNLYYHLCHQAVAQGAESDAQGCIYWQDAKGVAWPLGTV